MRPTRLPNTTAPLSCVAATLAVLLLLVAGPPARAQEQGDERPAPPPPVYPQLFADSGNGQNGYEEIALAIDALRDAKAPYTHAPGETLERRRAYLADPAVRRARGLLRQGLAKPIRSPRAGKPIDFSTTFPDLAGVRSLARVLVVEIYVACADGRAEQAIASMSDGLRLGYHVKGDALIGALVGVAIDTLVLEAMARHKEQWSVGDCRRILAAVQNFADAPDPTIDALEMERRSLVTELRRMLDEAAEDGAEVARELGPVGQEDPTVATLIKAALRWREAPPAARQAASSRAMAWVNAEVDALIARVRDPLAAPKARQPASGDAPDFALLLVEQFLPVYPGVALRTGENRSRLSLLAVHAALRRHRWEFGTLPASLEELNLPRFTTDPFTGRPLVYKRLSDTEYELSSAGAAPSMGGKREPVLLPRPPKPQTGEGGA